MTIAAAHKLARTLMREHGLIDKDWNFYFDRSVRRFGCCNHSRKTISLSQKLTELNDEPEVRDTILHEIAHALVGSKHGHDRFWRMKCIQVGATPKRCYDNTKVIQPPKKYIATCPDCSYQYKRHRVTKRANFCGACYRKSEKPSRLEWALANT